MKGSDERENRDHRRRASPPHGSSKLPRVRRRRGGRAHQRRHGAALPPPAARRVLRGEAERDSVFVEPETFYAEHDVEVRLDTKVSRVDTSGQAVELDGDRVEYGRLVLASGAVPRRLGAPGEEVDGVHVYRRLADATAVREAAASASGALVIGGGFIGMETTASLRSRGLTVTQLDRSDGLFASFNSPPLSRSPRAPLPRGRRRRGARGRSGRVSQQQRAVDRRGHADRPGDRGRPRDRGRRRHAVDRVPGRLRCRDRRRSSRGRAVSDVGRGCVRGR